MLKLTYHGHSTFIVQSDSHSVIIDPFLSYNPNCKIKPSDVKVSHIILTHGHDDHFGDTLEIAKANNAVVIAAHELAEYTASKGAQSHGMGIGGKCDFLFGSVKLTIAHHSSSYGGQYMGEPAGVILTIGGKNIYHAGDTGLFLDMKLIGEMNNIDIALIPIGDNYTMGIDDAVKAVEFLNPKLAAPIHYNTFDLIKADAEEFKRKVESIGKQCRIMHSGDTLEA